MRICLIGAEIGLPQGLPKYLCVGATGTVVNCAVLWGLVHWMHWHYLLAAGVAIQLAVIQNFIWHDRWTFSDRRGHSRWLVRFGQYELTSSGGMILNWILLAAFVSWAHWPLVPANLCGIAVGALVTYTVSKLWIWKHRTRTIVGYSNLGAVDECETA